MILTWDEKVEEQPTATDLSLKKKRGGGRKEKEEG